MTTSKNRKKTPEPYYRGHRRPGRRKSPGAIRAIPPPIAGGLADIREKRYPAQPFPSRRDSITSNIGIQQ